MTLFNLVAFANPWLLLGLLSLPVIWWLIRVTPPHPKRVWFPGTRLLLDLLKTEETPQRTPWWLLLMRLIALALVIVGLAGPLLNPPPPLFENRSLVLVVDNGWSAAGDWRDRRETALQVVDQAKREGQRVLIVPTADQGENAARLLWRTADEAERALNELTSRSWAPDRTASLAAIETAFSADNAPAGDKQIIWLSDGLDHGEARAFAQGLSGLGNTRLVASDKQTPVWAFLPPEATSSGLTMTVKRARATPAETITVHLFGPDYKPLAVHEVNVEAGARDVEVNVPVPLDVRNEAEWIEIGEHRSAGSVVLLDERWRRRLVGVVDLESAERGQPLLSGSYYLLRALAPFTEVVRGDLSTVLEADPTILITVDVGQIVGDDLANLEKWIEDGGMLLRFAGPRTANQSDALLPVPLRQGGRVLGGALSWETPQALADFDNDSPFSGLPVPEEVRITRQVLAEPSIELGDRTWARLSDGTPLVTAKPVGKGHIVLFHITANTEWSTLPLSGLFVDMLKKLVALSSGIGSAPNTNERSAEPWVASETLTGDGRLVQAPASARPLPADFSEVVPGPDHPPGRYRREGATLAFNLIDNEFTFNELDSLPATIGTMTLETEEAVNMKPWLLSIALGLLILDGLLMMMLSGRLQAATRRFRPRTAYSILVPGLIALTFLALPGDASAQNDKQIIEATLATRLAYVITGDSSTDKMSQAGLTGLSRALMARTSVEPGPPIGVNLKSDELSVYPFLYWPMAPSQQVPDEETLARIDSFMKRGGLILFDTADQQKQLPGSRSNPDLATPEQRKLREILGKLDIPPLEPIPSDHVMTKAFYLLQDYPGRWTGGRVWTQASTSATVDADGRAEGVANDGVTPLIIGSHDWAAAWAVDDRGRPLAPVIPGGVNQREIAFRFGINLVMYTLTGNYKADQVHVPALLERLGQ